MLSVRRTADRRAIRSAYRRLVRQCHPDVAENEDAVARFLLIQEAYETLSDPQRRREYDRRNPQFRPTHWRKNSAVSNRPAGDVSEFGIDILGIHISAGWCVTRFWDDG